MGGGERKEKEKMIHLGQRGDYLFLCFRQDLHGRPQMQAGHDVQQRGAGTLQPRLEQAASQGRALPAHLPTDYREPAQVSLSPLYFTLFME